MATPRPKPMTIEELMRLPDDGWLYELHDGELVRMPMAGGQHGEIETSLILRIGGLAEARGLGRVYTGDTVFAFQRDPDVALLPDVAFVRAERLPPLSERVGAMPVIPDLAVEIVSPSDRMPKVRDKIHRYLAFGVPLVWLIEPRRRQVTVYQPGQPERVLGMADELDGGDVLPGFRLPIAALFPTE